MGNPNHIENSAYCLCDDCTRGYTLATPRVMGGADIEYALGKLREEVSGTAVWSPADWRAAILAASAGGYQGAVRLPSTPAMVPVVPACCPECGVRDLAGHTGPLGTRVWYCPQCHAPFEPVAAVNPDWRG